MEETGCEVPEGSGEQGKMEGTGCEVPEGSGEHGKMEGTGCEVTCGAPTMVWWLFSSLERILVECSSMHSPPAHFFLSFYKSGD